MLVESGRRNELCMETVLPLQSIFRFFRPPNRLCRRQTLMLVSNRNLCGAPAGLVGLGRVPDRVADYEPQKEQDPSEQLHIVLQSTFRSLRTLMMCAPAMSGPPDPGRLRLFEGP